MKKHQFEEINAALSIVICLIAYHLEINWLFYIYFCKSILDTSCAILYAYRVVQRRKIKKLTESISKLEKELGKQI